MGNRACLINARTNTMTRGASIEVKASETIEILGEAAIHAKSIKNNEAEATQNQMFGKIASATVAGKNHTRLPVSRGMVNSSDVIGTAVYQRLKLFALQSVSAQPLTRF